MVRCTNYGPMNPIAPPWAAQLLENTESFGRLR
jgi:hypothetical protein